MQRVYLLIVFYTLLYHENYLKIVPETVESDGTTAYMKAKFWSDHMNERDRRNKRGKERERDSVCVWGGNSFPTIAEQAINAKGLLSCGPPALCRPTYAMDSCNYRCGYLLLVVLPISTFFQTYFNSELKIIC